METGGFIINSYGGCGRNQSTYDGLSIDVREIAGCELAAVVSLLTVLCRKLNEINI